MPASQPAAEKAAIQISDVITSHYGKPGHGDAATMVSAGGRMVGAYVFRIMDLKFGGAEPGTVILSVEANEEGPKCMQMLATLLAHAGVAFDRKGSEALAPRADRTRERYVETFAALAPLIEKIRAHHGLSLRETSICCIMATASIIKERSAELDPSDAFGIAVLGIIEGCKTVPPFQLGRSSKPWYKFW